MDPPAGGGARSAHTADRADSYVYWRGGEDPWERVGSGAGTERAPDADTDGLPTGEGVTRYVFDAGEFAVASNAGLYRSTDAGRTWARLDVEWPDAFADRTARGLAVVN